MTTLPYAYWSDKTSCFTIVRHSIKEAIVGFLELLEVIDAPKNRLPFIVYYVDDMSNIFFECQTIEDSKALFNSINHDLSCRAESNFKDYKHLYEKIVDCINLNNGRDLSPWFYALSIENIDGDFCREDTLGRTSSFSKS
jgi:hypothetical protein